MAKETDAPHTVMAYGHGTGSFLELAVTMIDAAHEWCCGVIYGGSGGKGVDSPSVHALGQESTMRGYPIIENRP